MSSTPLNKAIQIIGSQSELARRLGVRQQTVFHWLRPGVLVPTSHAVSIERETHGAVTVEELRPDLIEQWNYIRGTAKNPPAQDAA